MTTIPQAVATDDALVDVAADVVVVAAFTSDGDIELSPQATELDRRLDGYLAAAGGTGFKAKPGEVVLVPTLDRINARHVAVLGLGSRGRADANVVRRATGAAARRLSDHPEVASAVHLAVDDVDAALTASVEGYILGAYRYTEFKSDPKPSKTQRLSFLEAGSEQVDRGAVLAEAAVRARDLTNEPASSLTPTALARKAREMADVTGLSCEVLDRAALEAKGMGGILGVSQGSDEPPCLIKLGYSASDDAPSVALVGKGITYDTGGYSLKPAASMEGMKTDMAGAATVIGVVFAASRLRLDVNVTAYIPSSENMVSGDAIRPGDVLTQYGGKTVEVNNTDAEGRLVLADALGLAAEEEPEAMVDVATLTGHMHIALGGRVTGFFSNDDTLRTELEEAARASGEDFWPMPLHEGYRKDLDSETADMKNSGPRYGGAITAALFLKEFVPSSLPWAHLDIAGTGRADGDRDEIRKGGTGTGIRTLVTWLEHRAR